MKPHKKIYGFTLIELMVVVSLCTLMIHITTIYFSTFDFFIVQAEIIEMRIFFQNMRYQAINAQQEFIVTLDPVSHSYYSDNYKHEFPSAVRFGVLQGALGPPSSPSAIINKFVTFKDNLIHFFPDGTMSSGIIYVTDRARKIGYALSNGVGSISYLRLYRYDKGRWKLS